MAVTEKTLIGTIDLTPSWHEVLSVCLVALECGSDEGKRLARENLSDMATVADAYVAAGKAGKV